MIETTINDAWAKGLQRIELVIFASNSRAIALYEKMGRFSYDGAFKSGVQVLKMPFNSATVTPDF